MKILTSLKLTIKGKTYSTPSKKESECLSKNILLIFVNELKFESLKIFLQDPFLDFDGDQFIDFSLNRLAMKIYLKSHREYLD